MMMISGTIKNAVNLQTLTNKWEQKKNSGNIFSKKELNELANRSPEQKRMDAFKDQLAKDKEAEKQNSIANKIANGEKLTLEEEQYMEQKNPSLLQSYRQMQLDKKAYAEKLRHCKTKDEVQRLKTETIGGYLASLKKTVNNAAIPLSAKLAKAMEMLGKTRLIQKEEAKFMATKQYQEMPTEADEAKDRAEERELQDELDLKVMEENKEEEKERLEDLEEGLEETAISKEKSEAENVLDKTESSKGKNKFDDKLARANYDAGVSTGENKISQMETEIKDIYNELQLKLQTKDGTDRMDIKKKETKVGTKVNVTV